MKNVMAKSLQSKIFRGKKIDSKKVYDRKKEKKNFQD